MATETENIKRRLALVHAAGPTTPLDPPPPGGHDGGMEARVTRLEEIAHDSVQRLASMETKLDHVVAELSNMKWWFIGTILAIFLSTYGAAIAIQQMTVTTFQAAQPQQQAQPTVIVVPSMPAPAASR